MIQVYDINTAQLREPGSCSLVSQQEGTLGSQPVHLVIFTCKDIIAPGSVDYQLKLLDFKLYIYTKARLVQNMTDLQYFIITIIAIDYC